MIINRLHLTFVALAALLLTAAAPLQAGTIKFPKTEPTFVFDLPDGWTSKLDKDGNLDCEPPDDSGYSMSMLLLPNVHTKAEVKASLPKVVTAMSEGMKGKELEIGDVEDSKNEKSVPFTGVRADAKADKMAMVMIIHAFEPVKGKWYAIMTVGTKKADDSHENDYNSVYDSIQPLK
jgi:hypothetical protein